MAGTCKLTSHSGQMINMHKNFQKLVFSLTIEVKKKEKTTLYTSTRTEPYSQWTALAPNMLDVTNWQWQDAEHTHNFPESLSPLILHLNLPPQPDTVIVTDIEKPTLATLHRWGEAPAHKLNLDQRQLICNKESQCSSLCNVIGIAIHLTFWFR